MTARSDWRSLSVTSLGCMRTCQSGGKAANRGIHRDSAIRADQCHTYAFGTSASVMIWSGIRESRASAITKSSLLDGLPNGVRRAVNTLRPAELAFGTVDVPEHVHNRRWLMRPGTAPRKSVWRQ